MTTRKNMLKIRMLRKIADEHGEAARAKAQPGTKQMTYHHARQAVIAKEALLILLDLMNGDHRITGVSILKESKICEGTCPASFRLEIPLSLEEKVNRRDKARTERQPKTRAKRRVTGAHDPNSTRDKAGRTMTAPKSPKAKAKGKIK